MDLATLSLLQLGFNLADKLLVIASRIRASSASDSKSDQDVEYLQRYIRQSASAMEQPIHAAVLELVRKLEQDQLEVLLSRTRSLADLVEMHKAEQSLHYAMTLRESVDYAQNRLREGKHEWLGPYLAGNSIFLACLEYAGARSDVQVEQFQKAVAESKVSILDKIVPRVLEAGQSIPWLDVSSFIQGQESALLSNWSAFLLSHSEHETVDVPETPPHADHAVHFAAKQHLKGIPDVYVIPDIPHYIYQGAARKLLSRAPEGEPLVAVMDLTYAGGAKYGIAVFESCFIHNEFLASPYRFDFQKWPDNTVAKGNWVMAGYGRLNLGSLERSRAFANFLNEIKGTGLS